MAFYPHTTSFPRSAHPQVETAILISADTPALQPGEGHAIALWHAACDGNSAQVMLLLQMGACPNRAPHAMTDVSTPLLIATLNGHLNVVAALLDAGALVNQTTTDGATPLFIAAGQGHATIVNTLLNAGARINQATTRGATPLFIAAEQGHLAVVRTLLDRGALVNQGMTDGATPLLIVAQQGLLAIVIALLAEGTDVNQATTHGATPLLIAAQQGHLAVVIALLTNGANVNQAMDDGATPLYTAVLFGHFDIMKALMHNKNPSTARCPISLSTQETYPAFVKAFLSDETVRDYYLHQIIIKPKFMRDAFEKNPLFFNELASHRNALWSSLKEPARHHLSTDAHKTLLNAILDSHEEPNEALRHPLHALLYTPKRQRTGFFSDDSSTQSILDEIQVFMNTERPLKRNHQPVVNG